MGRTERLFQARLIRTLRVLYPGCVILKNDANYLQGVPDLLILWMDKWAALECKGSANAEQQPNQEHYVTMLDAMSFAAFIYPENEEDVLDALQRSFQSRRPARSSERQQASLDKLRRRQTRGTVPKFSSSQTGNRTSRLRS